MADQLVLDIPGVTTISADLRVGEQQWLLTHQPADQPGEVVHRG